MPRVTLFGKPGCHLCDHALAVVEEVGARRGFELVQVDITLDPRLHARYGERIPVISVDGEELFEYHLDAEALEGALDRVSS